MRVLPGIVTLQFAACAAIAFANENAAAGTWQTGEQKVNA